MDYTEIILKALTEYANVGELLAERDEQLKGKTGNARKAVSQAYDQALIAFTEMQDDGSGSDGHQTGSGRCKACNS